MADAIGTARLKVVVDTAEFDARVDAAIKKTTGMGDAADAAYTKTVGGAKRATDSLLNFVRQQGLSTDQQRLFNAAIRGVPLEVLNGAKLALEQNAAAASRAADQAARLAQMQQQQAEAQRQANAAQATRTNFIRDLEQQVTAIGKTKSQLLELKAAELGVAQSAAPLIKALRDQEAAAEAARSKYQQQEKQMFNAALSMKQYQAALRGVPAQVTDIIVSLQGGQAPLTVLLQQGGQLKDMFGGSVPTALRALASGFLGLVNPVTVSAAVLGTVAFAAYQGEAEMRRLQKSLIATGQDVPGLAQKLNDLAATLDSMDGVTRGGAADALSQIASTGVIAAENFDLVSRAALSMKATAGVAIEDTVDQFKSIAKDPVSAILELNKTYNFLTAEMLENIRVLQEQGRNQDAAAVATRAFAGVLIERSNKMRENLGYLESAWKGLKNAAAEAWDAMLNLGRANTSAESIKQFEQMISTLERARSNPMNQRTPGATAAIDSQISDLRKKIADLQKVATDASVGGAKASRTIDSKAAEQLASIEAGNRSRAEIQKREEEQIRNLAKAAGREADVEKLIAASRKKYQDSLPKGASGAPVYNAETSARLSAIKAAAQEEATSIQNSTKLLQANYSARLISVRDYYAQQRDLAARDQKLQEETLQKQIDYLQSRSSTGKDQININKQITELEAQLAKVRSEGAAAAQVLSVQENAVLKTRQLAIDAYRDSLDQSADASERSYASQVARIGLGQREAEIMQAVAAVEADVANKRRELAQQFAETNDREMYDAKLKDLEAYQQRSVEIVRGGYESMAEAEANWLNGLNSGIADWMQQAGNVAATTADLTKGVMDDSLAAVRGFIKNGEVDIDGFLGSLGGKIADFLAQQAIMNFMKSFGGMAGNTGTVASLFSQGSFSYFKDGASFNNSPSLNALSGTVLTGPTPFAFARGAGIAGEAGPEGVFPLKRGADGKLGVSMMDAGNGGGGQKVNVYLVGAPEGTQVNQREESDGSMSIEVLFGQMESWMASRVSGGVGPLNGSLKGRYGLKEQVG